ncbi:MAG: CopD family protein, partial [Gemmatimonadota bacterium]
LVPSLAALVGSAYGRLVLVKIAGLAVLVGFGAYHRFRLLPALGGEHDPGPLRRSVGREIAVMAAILLVAGFLAYSPPPGP